MKHPTDQDLDRSVATMLRIGVTMAAAVVLVGGVLLLRHPGSVPDYRRFQPGNPALESLAGILEGSIDLAPRSIIQGGLVLLIATPVARVALCVTGFARQRNRLYVGISSFVLLILLYSLVRK